MTDPKATAELKAKLVNRIDSATIKALIERGADVNAVSKEGLTPLQLALRADDLEMVTYLLSKGADPNLQYENVWVDLLDSENDALIPVLLEAGLRISDPVQYFEVNYDEDDQKKEPVYALFLALSREKSLSSIKLLVDAGATVDFPSGTPFQPLTFALERSTKDIQLYLISKATDMNVTDNAGETPLRAFISGTTFDLEVLSALIDKGADVNLPSKENNNETPLIMTMYIADEDPDLTVPFVKLLLEKGADKTFEDSVGFTAFDHAPTSMIELMSLVAPDDSPWKGLASSDLQVFQSVFESLETQQNVSMCPFCLQYLERSEACKYMKHECPTGRRHERLYRVYAPKDGSAGRYWCTICGRHCMGHRHYERSEGNEGSPGPLVKAKVANAQLFAPDCKPEGGGGIPEKVGRIQAMINAVAEFQDSIDKLPAAVVRRSIIEKAWGAPPIEGATSFTIPPSLGISAAAPATFPDLPRPAADAALVPVNAAPKTDCAVEAGPHDDDRPVFRFTHRLPDGVVYTHTDDQLICFEDMATALNGSVYELKGKCPFCKAKVHPDELKAIKDGSPEQDALYAEYRTKYNEYNKVGGRRTPKGGAEIPPLFVRMTNAQCALPKKAGRRTYRRIARRRQTRRRNTYRRKTKMTPRSRPSL